MKKVFLAFALSLGLLTGFSGCTGMPVGQTPEQVVFQAKSAYSAALTAAVAYKRLTPCSDTVKQPCSDPAIVKQLQKADTAASTALDAAETAVRTPGFGKDVITTATTAARAALDAFVSITTTLKAPS